VLEISPNDFIYATYQLLVRYGCSARKYRLNGGISPINEVTEEGNAYLYVE
jgi:hypothetical protein